tara:strand:- start:2464 stop:2706 length:243 start_codon:yes stop_codon:yes gene_type:complete
MKGILINIKNIIPYFIIVIIYFFFVNLEAKKQRNKINLEQNEPITESLVGNTLLDKKVITTTNEVKLRLSIPVIPYRHKD